MSWRVKIPPLIAMLMLGGAASANLNQLGPGHFGCNAPAGKYGEQEIPPLTAAKTVTVRIKQISQHFDPKWTTAAGVQWNTPLGHMYASVGEAQNDLQHIYVELRNGRNGDASILDQYPVTSDWIDLNLTLGYDGVVRVVSRGHESQLDLGTPWPVTTLLHCHSGAFEFQVVRPQG